MYADPRARNTRLSPHEHGDTSGLAAGKWWEKQAAGCFQFQIGLDTKPRAADNRSGAEPLIASRGFLQRIRFFWDAGLDNRSLFLYITTRLWN
jgi:hypothetical protein